MHNPLLRAILIFVGIFAVLAIAGRMLASTGSKASTVSLAGGYVALLNVDGVITASDTSDSFFATGEASSVELCRDLYEIAEDSSVKAVVMRVNSPGGSAAGSDEIYRAIKAVRAAGKPVVVSMGDIAASGGYYIASPADWVVANGATLTGSIGVIFQLVNIEELGKKIGVQDVTLHAGEYKDIGNPWRPMTAEEKKMLTGLLTDVHDQFIAAVDEGRSNLDAAQVRKLATGAIFTGQGALRAGLVDEIGDLRLAEAKARTLAKLDADAPVEEYGAGDFWESMFSVRSRPIGLNQAIKQASSNALESLAGELFLNLTLRDLVVR